MAFDAIRLDRRFRGPPTSGNGGYVAGLLATTLGGSDVVVTLRKPPPLDADLQVEMGADAAALYFDDGVLIATAVREAIELTVPPPPPIEAVREAETRFTGFCNHIFPGCFVCGPEREPGDGLRLFTGPLNDGSDRVAACFIPHASLADDDGLLRPEFLWSALDCPGYFAVSATAGLAVLGRLGCTLHSRPPVGRALIVTGWPIASDGRKHTVGTALHDTGGELIAAGLATWVSLQQEVSPAS
ncbi:hypothetical protein [Brevundimonas lenta]|uniref:Thioesterase family protein n=1 Tax=Brevundimonas lenta TaxID=424796 RepID=A0A7W6NR91_9CAUL|nr:hypothetical protein [Brevundimonas lenta]MBB4084017.1 hypothetical protein [Brevundimonas lenta]